MVAWRISAQRAACGNIDWPASNGQTLQCCQLALVSNASASGEPVVQQGALSMRTVAPCCALAKNDEKKPSSFGALDDCCMSSSASSARSREPASK